MRMYFKLKGKLTKSEVNLNSKHSGDVAKDLKSMGLYQCRRVLCADKNSPIMAIVK